MPWSGSVDTVAPHAIKGQRRGQVVERAERAAEMPQLRAANELAQVSIVVHMAEATTAHSGSPGVPKFVR